MFRAKWLDLDRCRHKDIRVPDHGGEMATDWQIEGPYVKSCSCDPGCPCDFNANPTHGSCEGIAAMHIDEGAFGGIDLSGLSWGAAYHWPGALHEGNGDIQPFIDEKGDEQQRAAILQILSGENGGTFFQVLAVVAPNVKEPVVCPIDFDFDLEQRSARIRFGDVIESTTETLRGIDPPDPYRVLIKIPGGMEYTNAPGEADVASAKTIRSTGAVPFDITDGHTSLAYVRHGNKVETAEYHPTVVSPSG
jgi:hypothetical protein